MPVYQTSGMDSKTLGAFRASGQADIGKFLATQGGAKDENPPGVPTLSSGGGANFQGTTLAERTRPSPASSGSVLTSGSIQAARRALASAATQGASMYDRLIANLGEFTQNIFGPSHAAMLADAKSLSPNTVMEAKAYGAVPTPTPAKPIVAPAPDGTLANRWKL